MSGGRPEFDAGDIVRCISDDATPDGRVVLARAGDHFVVDFLIRPQAVVEQDGWAFLATCDDPKKLPSWGNFLAVRECENYRRVDPLPPAVFETDADVSATEQVPA